MGSFHFMRLFCETAVQYVFSYREYADRCHILPCKNRNKVTRMIDA